MLRPELAAVMRLTGSAGDRRPLAMTAIRSAMANSSSRSCEMMRMAVPASAPAPAGAHEWWRRPRRRRPTSAAPRSARPGFAAISRPTRNFCRLPPERLRARRCPRPALRTAKSATMSRGKISGPRLVDEAAAARVPGAPRRSRRHFPTASCPAPRHAPAVPRARSTVPRRAVRAAAAPPDAAPSISMVRAAAARRSPVSASISSAWPLPATPAMPTISPPLTAISMSSRSTPNCSALGEPEAVRPASAPGRWRGDGRAAAEASVAPSIIAASCCALSWRGSQLATTLPRAQDGGAVAQRADLLELVARCRGSSSPPTTSRRSVANSTSTSCGVSTEVGSSMMMSCGRLQQAAHDFYALALADRKVADAGGPGSSLQAVGGETLRDARASVAIGALAADAERDVLRHRQRLEQREMLEHHADALGAGLGGARAGRRRRRPSACGRSSGRMTP